MWRRRPRYAAAILIFAAAVAALFFLNLCDLVFDCGCRAPWSGGVSACNIYDPAVRDCPWCAAGIWGTLVPFGAVLSAQVAIAFSRKMPSPWLRLLAALGAFPVVGGIVGVLFGLASGYWG